MKWQQIATIILKALLAIVAGFGGGIASNMV